MPREECIRAEELAAVLKTQFLEELCNEADLKYRSNDSDIALAKKLVNDGFLLTDLKLPDLKRVITEYYDAELRGCRTLNDCVERILELRSQGKSKKKSQKRKAEDSDEIICDPKTQRCYRASSQRKPSSNKKAKTNGKQDEFDKVLKSFTKGALKKALVGKWDIVLSQDDNVYDHFRELYDNDNFTVSGFKKIMMSFL